MDNKYGSPMLKDGAIGRENVWGTREGLCAWCNESATHEYEGEMTNGEQVKYQVCAPCYDDRVGESKWDRKVHDDTDCEASNV